MATASTNSDVSIKVMEDDLSCCICYNLLREPKELDCPHVFCLQCLQEWVKKGRTVECPECRHITIVPQGGLVNLKTNLRLKSMVEKYAERVEKQSAPICPNHDGENQHFFCVTCGVTICRDCLVLQHPISQHEIKELKVITTTRKAEMKAKMGSVEQEMKKIESDRRILDKIERQLQAAREKAEKDVKKRVQDVMSEAEAKGKEMLTSIHASYQQHFETLKQKQLQTEEMDTRLRNVHTATRNVLDTAPDHIYMKQHPSHVDKMETLCATTSHCEMSSQDLATLQFYPGSVGIRVGVLLTYSHHLADGVGSRIATTPDDMIVTYRKRVITVHRSDGELIRTHQVDCEYVTDIASNGKQIAFTTGSKGNSIHMIDFVTCHEVWKVDMRMTIPLGICYEPESNTLLVASCKSAGHCVIEQYCSTTGHLIACLASDLHWPYSMTVSQDSKIFIADTKSVKVYSVG
ncbi:tripartite motif-containing protein 2-like [Amphiura filiformis]|uniref:tripartite motif-containing protein 2-like n=1 Tax=Amphiura filiformis TaxID=82378 RepID=UPI003B213A46